MSKLLAALWDNIIAPVLAHVLATATSLLEKIQDVLAWTVANPIPAFAVPIAFALVLGLITRLENSRRRS